MPFEHLCQEFANRNLVVDRWMTDLTRNEIKHPCISSSPLFFFHPSFLRGRLHVSESAVRFRARFGRKQNRNPILFLSPITMIYLHISAKKVQKLTCWTPLAADRIPNRTQNRTCRQPLTLLSILRMAAAAAASGNLSLA
jgi:hypothetical protein